MDSLTYFFKILPQILKYVPVTVFLAVLSMLIAIQLGLVLSLLRESHLRWLRLAVDGYISLFRGVPALVQLFIIYFGLPQIFPALTSMGAVTAAVIAFSLKTSAYLAEIFRAALQSVDAGQMEAGLSVGMQKHEIYRRIVLPQAAVNALPATGNMFISLIKETSVAFALGVTELFAEGKMLAAESLRYFETYMAVGLVYWVLVAGYARLQTKLENALAHHAPRREAA
jgi:putative amino-acid transport system permease protein